MTKHPPSITAPHDLMQMTMSASMQTPLLQVLKKPPKFPCTEPLQQVQEVNTNPTVIVCRSKATVTDIPPQRSVPHGPHPEESPSPTDQNSASRVSPSPHVAGEVDNQHGGTHTPPADDALGKLDPSANAAKHLPSLFLGQEECSLAVLKTLFQHGSTVHREALRAMVQPAKAKRVI
eukprot:6474939-Amphidinium_carterae.4